jgi:predicted dehydrogenase
MGVLRLGLIGAGKHGSRYVKHLTEDVAGVELVALCRRDPDRGRKQASAVGAAYHADYRDLIAAPGVDAVVAAVPPILHADIAAHACRAGKALLLEKPLAATLADARHIRDLVEAAGIRCMVAQTLRFNTVVRALVDRLDEIRPLVSIYLSQRFEPSSLGWLDRRAESGGGVALHTGVHSFDLLRLFSGREVEDVSCETWRVLTRETEDNVVMTCRLGGGVRGAVMISRSTRSRAGLIELCGAGGQLVGDHALGFAHRITGWQREPIALPPLAPTVREALSAFVSALRSGHPFPVTVDDGLRAVAVVDACYRSARTGDRVTVEG